MTRLLIIAETNKVNGLNGAIKSQHLGTGDQFTVPLWPVGVEQVPKNITHFWCSWNMPGDVHAALQNLLDGQKPGVYAWPYDAESQPEFPAQKLAEFVPALTPWSGPV